MKFPSVRVRKPVRRFAPHNQFSEALKGNGTRQSAEQVMTIDPHRSPLCKAVDELGKGVIVVAKDGQVILATNRAKQWAKIYFGSRSLRLPEAMEQWVRNQGTPMRRKRAVPQSYEPFVVERGAKRLVVRLLPDSHQPLIGLSPRTTIHSSHTAGCLHAFRRFATPYSGLRSKADRRFAS